MDIGLRSEAVEISRVLLIASRRDGKLRGWVSLGEFIGIRRLKSSIISQYKLYQGKRGVVAP